MSNILVTAATGTVGSEVVKVLESKGHKVRAASRQGEGNNKLDFTDPSTFAPALEGIERVYIVSPPGHANQYELLKPFLSVLFATDSVKRIVTQTAQGVDADDNIPFRKLELAIEQSGKDYVHIRPTWFAQNFHNFWQVGQYQGFALPAGDAQVAFIDARDIALAAAAALSRDDIALNRGYELTGPVALTHGEAASILSDVLGKTIAYQPIDDESFRQQLAPSGMPTDYIELLVNLFVPVRAGYAAAVTGDVELLANQAPRELADYARDFKHLL